ncbi:MAG: prefoldin subunit beta [Thermoplasmata archaeon]|nr:prefoldin subunit beta [Thermoplasmata archaeon]
MAIRFEDLPPQVQNQLQQLQQFQQQFEMVVQQRLQIDIKLKEATNAIEELNKVDESTPIYKGVGNLIIKAKKEDVLKELQEEKESLEVRKKALETQEKRLKEKIEELQNKIQEALKGKAG